MKFVFYKRLIIDACKYLWNKLQRSVMWHRGFTVCLSDRKKQVPYYEFSKNSNYYL
jgi:hypothetical protein